MFKVFSGDTQVMSPLPLSEMTGDDFEGRNGLEWQENVAQAL